MYKIVLIHPNAGVNWYGYSEIMAIELARRLDNHFEVELISGAECGSFSRPIKSVGQNNPKLIKPSIISRILDQYFDYSPIHLEYLTSFFPCISYLLRNPADLIFPLNNYGGLFVANCIRAIQKTPILFTDSNTYSSQNKSLKRNLGLKPDHLIVHSPEVADSVKQIAPEQSLSMIPWGVDLTEFTPDGQTLQTGLSEPVILCVAPLNRHDHQRLELTIRAVASLPDASLLICGQGEDQKYYQALGDRLLGKARFQIRCFAYAQMPTVYRSASIFTLASVRETRGLAYLEAMASGLPVVTTDDPMRRYLVGDAGITCNVNNINCYAESLQFAIEKQWYHIQKQALKFCWQKNISLYRQIILHTVENTNSRLDLENMVSIPATTFGSKIS